MRTPDASHPISITPSGKHIKVRSPDGTLLADSRKSLLLQESGYPVVYYIPPAEIAMDTLAPSNTATHCPYKGEARYFSMAGQHDIAWSYEAPHDAVSEIKGYFAFYPDRCHIELALK